MNLNTSRRRAFSCATFLATLGAAGLTANSARGQQHSMQMGAEPGAPGTLTAVPGAIEKQTFGPGSGTQYALDFHGYVRVPLAMSFDGTDPESTGYSATAFHVPPIVPDANPRSWASTNNMPPALSVMQFTYGNDYASGTIGISAWNFTGTTPSAQQPQQIAISPAYITLRAPDLGGGKARLEWNVGAFSNRYGGSGRFDYGAYGTYLFGATNTFGETLTFEYDLPVVTLRAEHGIGVNGFPGQTSGATTFLHHAHLGAKVGALVEGAVHYLSTWTPDERIGSVPVPRLTVMGADARMNAGALGYVYAGVARAKAEQVATLPGSLLVMNAYGGSGFVDNFLGPDARGNGAVVSGLLQYDFSLATLLYRLQNQRFAGQGSDLRLSTFGMISSVSSDDAKWDGVVKLKYGAQAFYDLFPWLSAGARADMVTPRFDDRRQSFAVLTPKVQLKSAFFSHEVVTVQYSRYFYGGSAPQTPGASLMEPRQAPLPQDGSAPYDRNAVYVQASLWW